MINPALVIVTASSLIVATIMSVFAWTTRRDERRRAAARTAMLAAAIHERGADDWRRPVISGDERPGLFAEPAASAGTRPAAIGVVAAFAVAAVTGLVLMAESSSRAPRPGSAGSAAGPQDVPLELLALEHDRDDSQLVVRGIVRNPSSAAGLRGLTAVVSAFSKDGGLIAGGRAPAATDVLSPGAETPFVVTLPDADSVDRFRVSFATGNRRVPHVDRRGRNAVARQTE